MSTTEFNAGNSTNAGHSGTPGQVSSEFFARLGLEAGDFDGLLLNEEDALFSRLGTNEPQGEPTAIPNLGTYIDTLYKDPGNDLRLTPKAFEQTRALAVSDDDQTFPELLWADPTNDKAEAAKQSAVIKLLAGAGRFALGLKNRVSDVFAVRNESSHRFNRRTTAAVMASAVALGALGLAFNNHDSAKDKTAQTQEAKGFTPEQLTFMRSHLPEIDNNPAGAWVPACVRVWEPAIESIMALPEMQKYDLMADKSMILSVVFASSLGDPDAHGATPGRNGLGQIPDEVGIQVDPNYKAEDPRYSLAATILVIDTRLKFAVMGHDFKNDRAGLIRAIIEGPQPGTGYDPDPQAARQLANNVIMLDADLGKPTSDAGTKWLADTSVSSLVQKATTNLLEQGLLVIKKGN